MYPGSLGGPNWGGGALLGDSGMLLVNVSNVAFTGQLIPTATDLAPEAARTTPPHGHRMRVTMKGTPRHRDRQSAVVPGHPLQPAPWGKLVAVDLLQAPSPGETALGSVHEMGPVARPSISNGGTPNLGGGIATAGGLFFIGATMDRQFRAFDVSNGATLWQYTLPVDAAATRP